MDMPVSLDADPNITRGLGEWPSLEGGTTIDKLRAYREI